MIRDVVIGLDSSTTATKAIAWDRAGRALAEGRAPVPLSNPHPGHFEQDPEDWWSSTASSLREVTQQINPARIAAIAISNQRETFVPLTEDGAVIRPGTLWLDERAKVEVAEFAAQFGAERIHAITGKPCDVTPCIYRFLWMKKHEPENFARFGMVTELHGYLAWRLTGQFVTSTASADPAGVLDMPSHTYSDEILSAIGLSKTQFPQLFRPGDVMALMSADAARATGLLEGTPVVAGGGDGQCAGTGVNVFAANRAYINLGTAVVAGSFSKNYAHDRAFRTMNSVAEQGYIYESCIRTGTFLIDWMIREMFGADAGAEKHLFKQLEDEAAAVGIGAGGAMLVPYWSGVMTPYWRTEARGLIAGLNASHKRGHVYRALLDGIALEQTIMTDKIAETGQPIDHFVAIGGGSNSDLWCQILADATGRSIVRSSTVEASSLGAAMAAARGAGWFATVPEASAAMAGPTTRRFEPDAKANARYRELLAIYKDLWPAIADWNARLAAFADQAEHQA